MYKQKIVVVDYGVGNTRSLCNAINCLGYKISTSRQKNHLKEADVLLLPGVGAFDEAIRKLREYNLHHILSEEVLVHEKPILGICVGMQILANYSEENGKHDGLRWIDGEVVRLNLPKNFVVPHVGWNEVEPRRKEPLFTRNREGAHFYFDHSYHYKCAPEYVSATCQYGIEIVAAIQKDNIFGVQFHPEKSQNEGLKMLRSFIEAVS